MFLTDNKFKIILEDNSPVSLYQPDVPKKTTIESPEIPNIIDKPPINITLKRKQKTSFKFPLIYCLYILFFLEILACIIYLWISVRKKMPLNIIENRYHQGK